MQMQGLWQWLPQEHGWGEPAPSTEEVRNTRGLEAGLSLPASACGYDGRWQQNAPSWCSFAGKQVINFPGIGLFQSPCVTGAEIPNLSALMGKEERQKNQKLSLFLYFQENTLKVKQKSSPTFVNQILATLLGFRIPSVTLRACKALEDRQKSLEMDM